MVRSGLPDRVPPCAIRPRLSRRVPATVRTRDRGWLRRGDSCSPSASRCPGTCDLPRQQPSCALALEIQGTLLSASLARDSEFLFFPCLLFPSGTATFLTMPSSEASYETARRLRREQTPAE